MRRYGLAVLKSTRRPNGIESGLVYKTSCGILELIRHIYLDIAEIQKAGILLIQHENGDIVFFQFSL